MNTDHGLEQRTINTQSDEYVTDVEAARILGCKPATMRRWRFEGRGPRFTKFYALVRYSVSDLIMWRADRIVETRDSRQTGANLACV